MKLNPIFAMFIAAGLGGWTAAALAEDTVDVGDVEVTGQTLGNGQMVKEEAPKARSTVTKEALEKMAPTGNAIDKLKYTPGINVSSDDSTGLSGFNFTMRGMSSDQVGVSLDGIPVNDSGNYNLYPNLLGDPENLGEVFATQGSSEIDAPHIGSSGGNIGLVTLRPEKDFGVFGKQTVGSNNLRKTFVRLNTGEYNGLSNYISASHTEGDKWRGEGVLRADKVTLNSLFDDHEGNSVNAIINYHQQDNYNYSNPSLAQYKTYGRDFDYLDSPSYNANGKIRTGSGTSVNGVYRGTGYSVLMRNPFENVTASLTGRFQLRDDLLLTVAPYYYWANGGSFSNFSGPYSLNRTSTNTGGNYNLGNLLPSGTYNADGTPNSGLYYRPSITETWRPGINTSLKWDINDEHTFSTGYWYERARQRQSQPYIRLTESGKPVDVSPGYDDGNAIVDANGNVIQGRNYFTVTPAQKLFAQDVWSVTPDLSLTAGIAYDYSEREGENKGSLTAKKEKRNQTYHEFLPSFSAAYQVNEENQAFYNLTRNMRTPPNYVLYNKGESISLKPELSWNQELGWRFATDEVALSATLFYLQFKDRQISSYNVAEGDYEMLNVGTVINKGVELELSGLLPHDFNYYASYTYTKSEQQDTLLYRGIDMPTEGKDVAGVPRNMFNASLGWDNGRYYSNIVGKYVGKQYGDMTNDQSIPDYAIADLNLGVHLPVNKNLMKSAAIRLSVTNLFDKDYLSGVKTTQFSSVDYDPTTAYVNADPYYTIGEERTVSVSFEGSF
ncbi:iron complex outermembrane receptor protein [Pseudomonas sp. TE3786]